MIALSLRPRVGSAIAALSIAAILAGCSGSAAATSPGASTRSAAPSIGAVGAATAPPAPSAPSEAAGGPVGACTILTNDAVGKATGFTVAGTSGTDSICFYQSADKSKYLSVKLDRSQADMASMLQIEAGSDHVAGLGDDAFWTGTGLLFARKGDHAIELLDPDMAGVGPAGDAFRDALVTLARSALPNV